MTSLAALLELARRQAALACDGRWEETIRLGEQQEFLAESLGTLPAEARPGLEEARALLETTVALARAAQHEIREELERLGRGRRAVAAYLQAEGRG